MTKREESVLQRLSPATLDANKQWEITVLIQYAVLYNHTSMINRLLFFIMFLGLGIRHLLIQETGVIDENYNRCALQASVGDAFVGHGYKELFG